jgi:hypothetical protein
MEEVQVEPSGNAKPVITWVVVVDGQVYVRSANGPAGRWYQALLRQPEGALHAGQVRIPFRAELVQDAETIAQVSEAFQRKYGDKWPNDTATMLRPVVLPTTLRLAPPD